MAASKIQSKLFEPLQIGNMQLSHRVVMSPMTRWRASENNVQLPIAATYYAQRASIPGSFIVGEGTFISPRGGIYNNSPGIFTKDQIASWRRITDAVHAKGSFIFCQLLSLGRATDPEDAQKRGAVYGSSSATPLPDSNVPPKALSIEEIAEYVQDFVQAAKNAIEAGFDGVEIHGTNGYLVDQFIQDVCNVRTDKYGGSVENRSRFAIEITRAIVDAIGSDRVSIRLGPWTPQKGMGMADPVPQFTHLIGELSKFNLAYLHLLESFELSKTKSIDWAVKAWGNPSPIILAGGFDAPTALAAADRWKSKDVCVCFGRSFISNPDLPYRIRNGIKFAPVDPAHFINACEERGYLDHAYSAEFEKDSKL